MAVPASDKRDDPDTNGITDRDPHPARRLDEVSVDYRASAARRSRAQAEGSVYKPRTALGGRLWKIRQRIVASGQPLLGWDGIAREIAEGRRSEGDSHL